MILDAGREHDNQHRRILENELESVGIRYVGRTLFFFFCRFPVSDLTPHRTLARLNKRPPDIYFKRNTGGGIKFNAVVKLTKLGDDPAYTVNRILHEYRIHNCEVLFRDDCTTDDLIDVIEGNRKYIKCLYAYNKVSRFGNSLRIFFATTNLRLRARSMAGGHDYYGRS